MTDDATRTDRAAFSGSAIIALGVGVLALILPAPFSVLAAVAAIVLSLRAPIELKNDPALKGTSALLLGFLFGVGVLLVNLLTVLPALMVTLRMSM
jgi:hypothetical protein